MPHYYAYCETHGKVGNNHATKQPAINDANDHLATGGNCGRVYVKESNMQMIAGKRKYSYKRHDI